MHSQRPIACHQNHMHLALFYKFIYWPRFSATACKIQPRMHPPYNRSRALHAPGSMMHVCSPGSDQSRVCSVFYILILHSRREEIQSIHTTVYSKRIYLHRIFFLLFCLHLYARWRLTSQQSAHRRRFVLRCTDRICTYMGEAADFPSRESLGWNFTGGEKRATSRIAVLESISWWGLVYGLRTLRWGMTERIDLMGLCFSRDI